MLTKRVDALAVQYMNGDIVVSRNSCHVMKPLTLLLLALYDAGYIGDLPTDGRLRRSLKDGNLPMIKVFRGRYFWMLDDLPKIAAALNLVPPLR